MALLVVHSHIQTLPSLVSYILIDTPEQRERGQQLEKQCRLRTKTRIFGKYNYITMVDPYALAYVVFSDCKAFFKKKKKKFSII